MKKGVKVAVAVIVMAIMTGCGSGCMGENSCTTDSVVVVMDSIMVANLDSVAVDSVSMDSVMVDSL